MPLMPKVCGPLSRGVKVPVSSTVWSVSWVTPSGRSEPIQAIEPLDIIAQVRAILRAAAEAD